MKNKTDIQVMIMDVIVFIAVFVLSVCALESFYSVMRALFLEWLSITVFQLPYRIIWSWTMVITSLCLAIIATVVLHKNLLKPKRITRDKKYILELFSSDYYGEPCPTIDKVIGSIYGNGDIDSIVASELKDIINRNTERIKTFLTDSNCNKKILCINSRWGSGKTTSLLIAINESEGTKSRYVYESVFKYKNNLNEFIDDLLTTIKDTMLEVGIGGGKIVDSMINNLDSDLRKTFIKSIQSIYDIDVLSSDLILKLNNIKTDYRVYVIIDDLDRMCSEEIINTLSLLSVLRRIKFFKIIILADLDIIRKSLDRGGVVDAYRFIEKYLPSQISVKIDSGYNITQKILTDKIIHTQRTDDKHTVSGVYPALAAIFIGMLAKSMLDQSYCLDSIRYAWLDAGKGQKIPDVGNEIIFQLMQAPRIMKNRSDSAGGSYNWATHYNNVTRFQNIIYALQKRTGTNQYGPYVSVNTIFSDEDYSNAVDSWIFEYMEKRWDLFGFTIRDALDILEGIKYDQLPDGSAEQFAYIFNQLFPNEQIKLL